MSDGLVIDDPLQRQLYEIVFAVYEWTTPSSGGDRYFQLRRDDDPILEITVTKTIDGHSLAIRYSDGDEPDEMATFDREDARDSDLRAGQVPYGWQIGPVSKCRHRRETIRKDDVRAAAIVQRAHQQIERDSHRLESCACGKDYYVNDFVADGCDNPYHYCGYASACFEREVRGLLADRRQYAEAVDIDVTLLSESSNGADKNDSSGAESALLCRVRELAQEIAAATYTRHALNDPDRALDVLTHDARVTRRESSDRAVMAYLRHNFSNYDKILTAIPDGLGNGTSIGEIEDVADEVIRDTWDADEAYFIIRSRVHQAIAAAWPEIGERIPNFDEL